MYNKICSFVLIFIVPLKQHEPYRELCTLNINENQSICKQEAASDFSCSGTTSHKQNDARFILTSVLREIRFAVTAQWPEPLWQCKSPKSREPREEAGLAPLNQSNKTAAIYWGHWDNTYFFNPMKKLKTTHTKRNICPSFSVSFFFVFHFSFGVKLEHFLCFPTRAAPFCGPPHCIFMRLPCFLVLHLFCIRRELISIQLSVREGKA